MSAYTCSFGLDHPTIPHPTYPKADGHGYVTIEASSEPLARACAWHLFGRDWAFIYQPDHVMDPKWWPLGEIERFDAATVLAGVKA